MPLQSAIAAVLATWPWHWSASAWSALTFLVLFAAAVVAITQVREARRLREDQARPFVVIDFVPVTGVVIEIRVKNIGATLARNVRFEFEPALKSTHDSEGTRGPVADLKLFQDGIPALVPGREIKVFFDRYPELVKAALPKQYDVTIHYEDRHGRQLDEERTVLDLVMLEGTGGVTRHGLHDIHKQLEKISKTLAGWANGRA